ncbi:DUF3800 domain-containing protein [Escherichia coli]|uniref:DUF3800 domain-containing protein n=2 Tax=Enterobacteriaceae TaxID=543 RepID=UPI000BE5088A|nr:DUF3800 domain-containing protein [Escherichia coli]EFO2889397.1 DUF3800 domain-containing protein [Escherichia coli]EKT1124468.1 DUF3800 domain-containing protein [Escherichia coli]ELJ8185705.1 DUF3800 domain-containing protein [Escherichia coli]MCA7039793.1 DUF3800 domain-containing protein [Escherichia coli]MED9015975.1 DUF3800 domain-containing protein [Escherichia coli]
MMEYFLDESGNTGDLINKKNDMGFANQPLFTHSCVGVAEGKISRMKGFVRALKKRHGIDESIELKSQDYYIKNPELVYELVDFVIDEKYTLVCEVMDKKCNVAVSIVNQLIVPAMENEDSNELLLVRNILVDIISTFAPEICFTTFSELCKDPSEEKLNICIESLKEFFSSESNPLDDNGGTCRMFDKTLQEFEYRKSRYSADVAIKWFVPIPDLDSNGNVIKLLPNVHSFYNQIARLNKIHKRKLSDIVLTHDTSSEFASTLDFCISEIKTVNVDIMPKIPTCDFKVIETPKLIFKDSKDSTGIQIADIIAGFLNRYVHGLLYKGIKMDTIYHATFDRIITPNRSRDPKGTNFVIPLSKQHWLFSEFNL